MTETTNTDTTNLEKVLAFCQAWNARNLDRIMGFMSTDCLYENVPTGVAQGSQEIEAQLQPFIGEATDIEWIVYHIAESPSGVVLTERLDRFLIGERWIEMRVMGTFEFADGKIAAWRDYWDMAQYQQQMAGQ